MNAPNNAQTNNSGSNTSEKSGLLSNVPIWGSYLYQNFLLPAMSPSEWLNTPSNNPTSSTSDYFGTAATAHLPPVNNNNNVSANSFASLSTIGTGWNSTYNVNNVSSIENQSQENFAAQPIMRSQTYPQPQMNQSNNYYNQQQQSGPSSFYPQPFYSHQAGGGSIPTSLLTANMTSNRSSGGNGSNDISPSVDIIDMQVTNRSPSPMTTTTTANTTPSPKQHNNTLSHGRRKSSAIHTKEKENAVAMAKRRRGSSFESVMDAVDPDDDIDLIEHDQYEITEGVERDGIIWGMKVEDYRALSARERKRVRNRISARTFRAKRKEHLSSLETDLNSKDLQIKVAKDEAALLRNQVAELERRLA